MSTITDTRLAMDHHHLSGPTHLDSTWPRLMEYPSRDRKSPVQQYPRYQAPMSPMHNFEPALKQESFRPTPPAETQRRTSEPTARKEGPIAEDKDHFDTSAGRAGWKLSMYQSPKSGKVSTGKEKDRKPLDPPPFVQLNATYQADPTGSFISSPYYFMKSELVEPDLNPDTPPKSIHNGLSGTQVSSLYKLKDAYGHSGAFFTFGDMAVTKQGKFRLKFTLYERPFNPVDHSYALEYVERSYLYSPVFTAFPARTYPGLEQSTPKTQGFAEQGVRLRIRKESLAAGTRKRNLAAVVTESPVDARRGEAVRRRIAYTSAQLGGPSTLALASPTQLVPTQAFPTPPQQHHHTQHHHTQQQHHHHHHHSSHTPGGSDASNASYVWTSDIQGVNPFAWSGSPIGSAPAWQSHHHHHHSAHSSQGSAGH